MNKFSPLVSSAKRVPNGTVLALTMKGVIPEKQSALETLTSFFDALNQAGVRYCHWKSNLRLSQALVGQTDLDLLVDPGHIVVFRRILRAHDIKPMATVPSKRYPGVENYLGFDPPSGKLFHLHVHYQLVLGEQFVKNYRVPLEALFLDSVRMLHGILTPSPELELIILSIRALLKYRDRDVLKDVLSIRSSGLPEQIQMEIRWLLEQTSLERISHALEGIAHIVPAEIVLSFLATVLVSPRHGFRLYGLRARLRRTLRPYQRQHRLQASLRYFQELWRRRIRFVKNSSSNKMSLPNHGLTLAIIGADGAGKSTICHTLDKWLAWKLNTKLYYMGSKQPSLRSKVLYLLFRMARRGHRTLCRLFSEKGAPAKSLAGLRQLLLYSYYISLGYDRFQRYKTSRELAAAGSIVLYDRYPLAALLDGPKILTVSNGNLGKLSRGFSRLEQNIYRKIESPDNYILLNVNPAVSLQRKPEHDRAAIDAKCQFLGELAIKAENDPEWSNLVNIDANLLFDEVISQLKMTVWQAL